MQDEPIPIRVSITIGHHGYSQSYMLDKNIVSDLANNQLPITKLRGMVGDVLDAAVHKLKEELDASQKAS